MVASVLAKDVADGPLPVDQSHHLILVVRHVAKPFAKHRRIDLEHRVERREKL